MNTRIITVNDKMQQGYSYKLSEPTGENFHPDFKPELTPKEMLELGVFGGKYLNDCQNELPNSWFKNAITSDKKNPALNYFAVDASQSLRYWQTKGWILPSDPRGWFQWYCRYYMGRRITDEDEAQIKRWRMMRRHVAQIAKNCPPGELNCRRKQRQALLHWAYDSRKI
ncbi:MAG: hypothetical protein WD061_02430 [Candidatus Saccharimonadales bacterium]